MTSAEPPYPIRDAFILFYPEYEKKHPSLCVEQKKAAYAIMRCKTGALGYNASYCEDCGLPVIHAVSCNNRSCPCCQAPMEKKWELERNTELIEGIAYYHVVFTVPHELNTLIKANRRALLGLLFKCAQETILALCADKKFLGAKPGIVSVLHTWGQRLVFHPHLHLCISGGGISPAGQFVETRHRGFFLPEAVMASLFRGKYLDRLKKMYENGTLDLSHTRELEIDSRWKAFLDRLYRKKWFPFIKETFNGRGNAIRYLARYSFRTAIANSRIAAVTGTHVTFRYRDYADGNKVKQLTVRGTDFIGMFLQHILPKAFNRVRFSGYLANCMKKKNLMLIHRLRNTVYPGNPYQKMKVAELILVLYGKDICSCPKCSGHMVHLPRGLPISRLPPQFKEHFSAVS